MGLLNLLPSKLSTIVVNFGFLLGGLILPKLSYKSKKLKIIDIRTYKEWKMTGIIPNSYLINMHEEDFSENINFIKDSPLTLEVKNILSNSFGFGGTNVSLIFSKFNG